MTYRSNIYEPPAPEPSPYPRALPIPQRTRTQIASPGFGLRTCIVSALTESAKAILPSFSDTFGHIAFSQHNLSEGPTASVAVSNASIQNPVQAISIDTEPAARFLQSTDLTPYLGRTGLTTQSSAHSTKVGPLSNEVNHLSEQASSIGASGFAVDERLPGFMLGDYGQHTKRLGYDVPDNQVREIMRGYFQRCSGLEEMRSKRYQRDSSQAIFGLGEKARTRPQTRSKNEAPLGSEEEFVADFMAKEPSKSNKEAREIYQRRLKADKQRTEHVGAEQKRRGDHRLLFAEQQLRIPDAIWELVQKHKKDFLGRPDTLKAGKDDIYMATIFLIEHDAMFIQMQQQQSQVLYEREQRAQAQKSAAQRELAEYKRRFGILNKSPNADANDRCYHQLSQMTKSPNNSGRLGIQGPVSVLQQPRISPKGGMTYNHPLGTRRTSFGDNDDSDSHYNTFKSSPPKRYTRGRTVILHDSVAQRTQGRRMPLSPAPSTADEFEHISLSQGTASTCSWEDD